MSDKLNFRLQGLVNRWAKIPKVNRELVCAELLRISEHQERHFADAQRLGFTALATSSAHTNEAWLIFIALHDAVLADFASAEPEPKS